MKRALIIIAAVLASVTAYAQGTINFQNRDTANGIAAPVYILEVGGEKCDGDAFLAQLYAGPSGAAEDALVGTGPIVNFRSGAPAGYVNVGAESSRAIAGVDWGQVAAVQIRAWSATYATYEEAAASTDALIGSSIVLEIATAASALNTPSPMIGLESFAVVPVPEPSTIALGLLGAAFLLLRRRK
jgi:hypothetical protein